MSTTATHSAPEGAPRGPERPFTLHLITREADGRLTRRNLPIESGVLVMRAGPPLAPEEVDQTLPLDLGGDQREGA
jgi:hypothetical protein